MEQTNDSNDSGMTNATRISTTISPIERSYLATGLTYDALVAAFERELGRWDAATGERLQQRKAPWSEAEQEVAQMAGPRGLMVFSRVDQGAFISLSGDVKRCSLYLVGNPVIANQILRIDLRASLYVPFQVCLYDDGGPGGAVISYDRPSSFLAALGKPELNDIGILLDGKIDNLARALRTKEPS